MLLRPVCLDFWAVWPSIFILVVGHGALSVMERHEKRGSPRFFLFVLVLYLGNLLYEEGHNFCAFPILVLFADFLEVLHGIIVFLLCAFA
jgi:hypothetical protein